MQRRKVDTPFDNSEIIDGGQGLSRPGTRTRRSETRPSRRLGLILIVVIIAIVVVIIIHPSSVNDVEHELSRDVGFAEKKMEEWLQKAKPKQLGRIDASQAMKEQPSSWVDGEKKLKAKLKVLAERQKEGKDLGVPVLTRFLGDDFPAWVERGQDEKAWKQKRDAKYEAMRKEDLIWREKAIKALG